MYIHIIGTDVKNATAEDWYSVADGNGSVVANVIGVNVRFGVIVISGVQYVVFVRPRLV